MLILDFDNIRRFCIEASILCLKQILDCVHIVPTVIGYVNILLKSIVYEVQKDWVSNKFYLAVYLYIYMYLICDTLINY